MTGWVCVGKCVINCLGFPNMYMRCTIWLGKYLQFAENNHLIVLLASMSISRKRLMDKCCLWYQRGTLANVFRKH